MVKEYVSDPGVIKKSGKLLALRTLVIALVFGVLPAGQSAGRRQATVGVITDVGRTIT